MSVLTMRHELRREGAPYDIRGVPVNKWYGGVSGEGFGRCSCGAFSPTSLPSGAARKRWHREHKAEAAS